MVKRGQIAKSNADLVRSIVALCAQYPFLYSPSLSSSSIFSPPPVLCFFFFFNGIEVWQASCIYRRNKKDIETRLKLSKQYTPFTPTFVNLDFLKCCMYNNKTIKATCYIYFFYSESSHKLSGSRLGSCNVLRDSFCAVTFLCFSFSIVSTRAFCLFASRF
jgi:hypothetical protein